MSDSVPLFVPLKSEWFHSFAAGRKRHEVRLYGRRWNEATCTIGRAVTLSHGYGGDRIVGHVTGFGVCPNDDADYVPLYPRGEFLAIIELSLRREASGKVLIFHRRPRVLEHSARSAALPTG